MRTLVVMRGVPGSGKSYAARKLADADWDNSIICSTDSYFVNYGHGTYKFDPSKLGKFHSNNLRDAIQCMASGFLNVIIDNTNITRKDFAPYVEAAAQYGYEVVYKEPDSPWWLDTKKYLPLTTYPENNLVELSLLLAEVFERKTTHGVPVEAIARMLQRWENV